MCLGKTSWLSCLVLALAWPVLAQEPIIEYGHPDELRGVRKIFVNTGVAAQQRDMIVKVLHKQLPNLEVVSRPEEADIHLRFWLRETRDGQTEGGGTVVKLVGGNRERVLLSIRDLVPPIFERGSIVSYGIEFARPRMVAREFVKAYLRANS